MKLVGTATWKDLSERFCVWEIPPGSRTIIADETYCFIPFPYIYAIVGSTVKSEKYLAYSLSVAFRPSPITPEDHNLYNIETSNNAGSSVCLGDWPEDKEFATEKSVAEFMMELYFSSPFENSIIYISQENGNVLRSFHQWEKFKDFREMNIDWKSFDVISIISNRWQFSWI